LTDQGEGAMAKLLIVEDNEASREMLAKRLCKRGHEVTTAVSGEEGWRLARTGGFAAIILDIGLPDMSGYEWARRAREDQGLIGVPIVAWTAHAGAEEKKKALESGCDAVVTKPLDWLDFSRVLEGLLARPADQLEVMTR
jgi:CheY-like chemotaxis protein